MGFLKNIFGPTKKDIWGQVADEIGGQYVDNGFWKGDVLRYQSGEWEIILDTYTQSNGESSTTYTRMRAPFVNKDNLHFRIFPKHIFSGIGKFFGAQDIEIGDPYFDEKYIIKGNSEERLRELLQDSRLKEYIDLQPRISFYIEKKTGFFTKKYPTGVDVLCFQCTGVIKDVDRLKALFLLFAHTLHLLCRMDSAYENTIEATDPFGFL